MIAPIKKRLAQAFPIYELKITLCGSNPAIWRRVQVPGGIKLNRLHDVLQVVMGWTDSHLHQFRVGSVIYCLPSDDDFYPGGEQRDERRFRLADIAQREKTPLIYEYDFGDSTKRRRQSKKDDLRPPAKGKTQAQVRAQYGNPSKPEQRSWEKMGLRPA